MPESADNQFTTFKIAQEVITTPELRRFQEKVQELGRLAFPAESQAFLPVEVLDEAERAELLAEDEFGPPILSQAAVGVSRLTMYRNLELPLLQRSVPRDMNYIGKFSWAVGKLREKNTVVANPIRRGSEGEIIRTRTHDIHAELARAALAYDGMVGPDIPVKFSGVTWYQNPFKRLLEVALVPDPESPATMLWGDMAVIGHQALAGLAKKTAYPAQNISPVAAFARVPANADIGEKRRFVKNLKEILPVHLSLGDITMDIIHRESL